MSFPAPPPTARDCVCPAPDEPGGADRCAEQCWACMVLPADDECWAVIISDIVDTCTVDRANGGDIIVAHRSLDHRLVIYGTHWRAWVWTPHPASSHIVEHVSALDSEHPDTLDDARWIAASWLATQPSGAPA